MSNTPVRRRSSRVRDLRLQRFLLGHVGANPPGFPRRPGASVPVAGPSTQSLSISELDCETAMGAMGAMGALNAEVEKKRKIVALLKKLKTKAEYDLENCQELQSSMLSEIRRRRISPSLIGDLEASNLPPAPGVDSWEDEPMPDPMTGLESADLPITPRHRVMGISPRPTSTAPQNDDARVGPDIYLYPPPVTSGGGSGGGTLDMVAEGLAESDQAAALLAQALQKLPEEDREQFGLDIADLLN